MMQYYIELKGCKEGERNHPTNAIWCKLRQEFCEYIKVCPLGYKKEKQQDRQNR
jgi:hypothetical protein